MRQPPLNKRLRPSYLLKIAFLLLLSAVSAAADPLILGINGDDGNLEFIDRADASNPFSLPISWADSNAISQGNALSIRPGTREVFAVVRLSSPDERHLVRIDLDTLVATDLGDLGDRFAGIAFNADGSVLYGLTGKGATVPEALFTINQSTASTTKLCDLAQRADDGDAFAFNTNDGLLYHWSGSQAEPSIMERIDDPATCAVTDIGQSGSLPPVTGAYFDTDSGLFYALDDLGLLNSRDPSTGANVIIGDTATDIIRGISLLRFSGPEIAVFASDSSHLTDGETTTSYDKGTNFQKSGLGAAISRSYTIYNFGDANLTLNGQPSFTGSNPGDFSVSANAATTITPGTSTTFTVDFSPTALGARSAFVSIQSNDANETPFTFAVQGEGVKEISPNDVLIGTHGTTAAFDATQPSVAYNPVDDEFLVVWRGFESNNVNIFGRRIDPDSGQPIGSQFEISATGGTTALRNEDQPDVVWNSSDQEFFVVWRGVQSISGAGGTAREIYGRRVDADGTLLGSEVQISDMGSSPGDGDYGVSDPEVAYDSTNNQYLVVWSGDDDTAPLVDGEQEIFGQLLTAAAVETGSNDFRISDAGTNGDAAFDAVSPDVVYNSIENEYLVVWHADDGSGSMIDDETEIYGQLLQADGTETGSNDFRISDAGSTDGNATFDATNPVLAYNSEDNEYLVVWTADDDTGSLVEGELEIFGQRITAAGAETGSNDFRISMMGSDGNANFDANRPQVSYNSVNKEYLVVWRADDDTVDLADNEFEIFGQRLSPTGAELGEDDFRVSHLIGEDGDATRDADFTAVAFGSTPNKWLVAFDADGGFPSLDNKLNVYGQLVGSPSIQLKGNGQNIANGDTTPELADHTDFGGVVTGVSSKVRTFTIENPDTGWLLLTGSPLVSVSGPNAGDFVVTMQPAADVPPENGTVTFQVTFSRATTGTSTATISIESDDHDNTAYEFDVTGLADPLDTDSDGDPDVTDPDDDNDGINDGDEPGFGTDPKNPDSDGDGADDGTEVSNGTDPLDPDTDGDGVNDGTEFDDGTNPLDPGSALERFGKEVCVEWNGFVDFLTQIMELRNTSSSSITVDVTLYDILGVAQDTVRYFMDPGIQRDVIINALNGFTTNSYGLVCANIFSGPENALGGQLVTYRLTGTTYTLAFASEFLPARTGKQYFTYNTFQPSLDPFDASNFVANWVQLVNDESTSQSGVLRYYDFEGNEVRTENVFFNPGERRDIDIHTLGSALSGMVAWEPNNSSAKFRMRQNRYFYGPNGLVDLIEAVSLPGKRGTGEALAAPFDTTGRTVALEISNTSSSAITVSTTVRDAAGAATTTQPPLLGIPARGTRGIVLNEYLATGLGNVQIDSDTINSMIVNIVEYGRSGDGSLLYANPSSPQEPLGTDIRGSYNSFLGQACRIRVASVDSGTQSPQVTMTRFDGTVLINGQTINVPANGATELSLCSAETQQAYGEVKLENATKGVLAAEVLRQNAAGDIEFGSPLKPAL